MDAASSLIVVLVVASGELSDPATTAMTQTAQDALEGRAVVIVRDGGTERITDGAATSLGRTLHADAVAVVIWSRPDRRRALVHVYRARDASWVDRSLSFGAEDPGGERGRMLGFEVAAMIPSAEAPSAPETGPEKPPALPPAGPAQAARTLVSVDLVGVGSAGLGGAAGGFGGELSARYWATETIAARLAAGLRAGNIAAANASSTVARLGLGLASRLLQTGGSRPITLGARLDLLAIRHAATSDRNASGDAHWTPGADAALEGAWLATPTVGLVAAMGVEVAAGTTRVLVADTEVATMLPFRLVGEAGLRLSF